MWPNRQFPADLVTFTEEIVNGKLHFLRSISNKAILAISKIERKLFVSILILKAILQYERWEFYSVADVNTQEELLLQYILDIVKNVLFIAY